MEFNSFNLYAIKVGIWIALLSVGFTLVWHSFWGGLIVTGLAMAHGVELQHQSIHAMGLKNKNLNYFFGFLLGAPLLVSFREYQINHMHHHKYLGTTHDSEQFDYTCTTFVDVITSILLVSNVKRFFKEIVFGSKNTLISERNTVTVRKEKIKILLLHICVFGACISLFGWKGVAYYLGAILVASVTHYLIEIPEHLGCNRKSQNVYENTRTIKSNWFMFWFSNGNNYHVEHHDKPHLRPEECIAYHDVIKSDIIHYKTGYISFYGEMLKSYIGKQKGQEDTVKESSGRNEITKAEIQKYVE